MEKFPSFENKQESPNKFAEIADMQGTEIDALAEKNGLGRFIEGLKNKIKIAVLCGTLSLVATGCSKKTEQSGTPEGASRFPRAEQVIKEELETRKSRYPGAENVVKEKSGIKKERRGIESKRYEESRKNNEITEKRALEIAEKHGIDTRAMQGGNFTIETRNVGEVPISIKINGKKIEVTREDLTEKELDTLKMIAGIFSDSEISDDDSPEMKAQKKEITENNRETRAILQKLGVAGDNSTSLEGDSKINTSGSKVRTSPDFDTKPGVRGSKRINLDNF